MTRFVIRRLLLLIPFMFAISVVSFAIIQLPPGDYVDTYVRNLEMQGGAVNQAQIDALRARYGLDQSLLTQYWLWISNVLTGDFGNSFLYDRPVGQVLAEHTHHPLEEIYEKTCQDSCFGAEEAVAFGLADRIITQL